MLRVVINEIEFYGYHGITQEERAVGHRFCADVVLTPMSDTACRSDNLADAVDYAAVIRRVVEIGSTIKCNLVEAVAEGILTALLSEFEIECVSIKLVKRLPPLNMIVQSVGVELIRHRTVLDGGTQG